MNAFCKIFTSNREISLAAILIAFALMFSACGEVGDDDVSGSGSEGGTSSGSQNPNSSSSDDNEACSGQYCCNGTEYDYKTNFCYEAQLYPLCGGKNYNPYEKGCFDGKEYFKCELPAVRGICVHNSLLKCRQEGPAESHIQDTKLGMECQPNGAITGTIKDVRDGRTYKIVQINNQIWLAENLNFEPTVMNSSNGPGNNKCHASDPTCTYGRLYDWATALDLPENCNYTSEGACTNNKSGLRRGLCPQPFAFPKKEDWVALISYAGESSTAGGRLKSSKPQNGDCPWKGNGCGTDNFNFNALPNGRAFYWGEVNPPLITSEDVFRDAGYASYWWADAQENVEAYHWYFRTEDTEARTGFIQKDMQLDYVRCVHYGGN
jgi:uncharacterized protein (TIGR02145 family)